MGSKQINYKLHYEKLESEPKFKRLKPKKLGKKSKKDIRGLIKLWMLSL